MKRSSALETLKTLRQRQHDGEQSRLAASGEQEQRAVENETRARQALLGNLNATRLARRAEDLRLEQRGISAAEGQRRALWEAAARHTQQRLSEELARAVEARRQAESQHEEVRLALQRSHVALEQVQKRLQHDARSLDRKLEQARQEGLDEASSRHFAERQRP